MIWLLFLLIAGPLVAQRFGDTAVIPSFQKLDPEVREFKTLLRARADDRHDLLLIWGGPRPLAHGPPPWWGPRDVLGLFLQDRERPGRVYQLALLPNKGDQGSVRVKRLVPGELVLSQSPECGMPLNNLKFFFDTRSKSLIRQVEYRPFAVVRILQRNGAPYFIAGDHKRFLVIRPAERLGAFQILPERDAQKLLAGLPVLESSALHPDGRTQEHFISLDPRPLQPVQFGPQGRFTLGEDGVVVENTGRGPRRLPLPLSTYEQLARARPPRVRDGYRPEGTTIAEEIGPHQVVDAHLWFGKTFYDGEGQTGVGGFGYFDPEQRQFVLFSPPEIRDWSVCALLVEPDAVWAGLVQRGEYGGPSGGLLRWDRAAEQARRFEMPSIINAITRYRDRLYLATQDGIAILDDGGFERYMIDVTLSGAYQVVPQSVPP